MGALACIRYYPMDEKSTKDLLKEVISKSPDDTSCAITNYMSLYPDCIFDDEYIKQAIANPETNFWLRFNICQSVMKQYKDEKNQERKKRLLDKAFGWAFLDANLEVFQSLDRFLLDNKAGYADLPERKKQLEKDFALIKSKKLDNTSWYYRRTEAALKYFGQGPKAQEMSVILYEIQNIK